MKLPDIRTTVAAACAFLALEATTIPTYAYTLEVTTDESGQYYGNYATGDNNARIYVSTQYINNEEGSQTQVPYISGIDASDMDIILPEQVLFSGSISDTELAGKALDITACGYENYGGFSWGSSSNVSVTIPECYTGLDGSFWFYSPMTQVTLESTTPPTIWDNGNGDSNSFHLKIIVNDNDVTTYRTYCANNQDGWHEYYTIFSKTHRDSKKEFNNTQSGSLFNALTTDAGWNLNDIYDLKLTGTIQTNDMNVFSLLTNLISLDLSGVTIEMSDDTAPYIEGCKNLYWLETVVLPSSVKGIYDNAFEGCHNLRDINLDNVITLGNGAFKDCANLTEVNLPNIETIGGQCFIMCSNLNKATVGNGLKKISQEAFFGTGLESFDIPFGCKVEGYVFRDSSVKELTVRDNSGISDDSFVHMNSLESFKCFDPYPYQGVLNMYRENNNQITLYVPEFALAFYNTDNYKAFISHKSLTKAVDYIEAVRPMEVSTVNGIADHVSFKLRDSATYGDSSYSNDYPQPGNYGSFTNKSTEPIHISKLTQNASYKPAYNNGIEIQIDPTSTFISDGEVTVDNMEVNLQLLNGSETHEAWNFISFPFDVKMNEIKTPEDALWTMMRYDGEIRASRNESEEQSQSAWVKLEPETVLEAGKGYILHYTLTTDNHADPADGPFTFSWDSTMGANTAFSNENATVALAENNAAAGFEHNSSWNLVGNPYDAFFLCRDNVMANDGTKYATPITVWRYLNGNYTYEAFSLVDDNFALRPFEAFFVQRLNGSDMTFKKEGRRDATQINELVNAPNQTQMPALSAGGFPRSIFNLHITGACGADRTRLVVNDEASADYEIACDASKFFSMSDAPQIFMTQGSVSYAINERPFGDGEYPVGLRISKPGTYTVSADSRNSEGYTVKLVDNRSGEVTDLNEQDYTFTSEAGTDNARFTLRLTRGGSGVESVDATEASLVVEGSQITVSASGAITVYAIDGKTVAEGIGSLTTSLPAGVYVVKAGNMVKKAVIGK